MPVNNHLPENLKTYNSILKVDKWKVDYLGFNHEITKSDTITAKIINLIISAINLIILINLISLVGLVCLE